MAAGVMDCSQRRLMGCFALVYRTMLRKINSPSRPASQALTSASTSARLISFLRTFSRGSLFSIGSKSKCGGMTGRFERPFAARGLDAFRRHDGEQMADGRRNDVLVAFVKVVHFLETAERLGDVAGDGRFLRNDESFAHFYARACTPGAANMRRKSFLSNLTRKIHFGQNSPPRHRTKENFDTNYTN
jgi:hypothetical protein